MSRGPTFTPMQKTGYQTIIYRGQTFRLAATALGGTSTAPKLKPADELLLDWAYETGGGEALPEVATLHDRAGVLCTSVRARKKVFVSNNHQHYLRLLAHYERNALAPPPANEDLLAPPAHPAEINLLQVPKSLELFELYLRYVALGAGPQTRLAAAFQTRHFTPKLLEIAARYARTVTQSLAYKKARLLLLSDFKPLPSTELPLHEIDYAGVTYRQLPGVFSAGHIDYATQFMLEAWSTNALLSELPTPFEVVDVGCGNGIIGDFLLGRYPEARLTAFDVSRVAVTSAQRNLADHGYTQRSRVLLAHSLDAITTPERFDLIVTNPPFHDEFVTDITVSTSLFDAAAERLTANGHLVVVANRHLNYATHLRRSFDEVVSVAENEKFVVYRAC